MVVLHLLWVRFLPTLPSRRTRLDEVFDGDFDPDRVAGGGAIGAAGAKYGNGAAGVDEGYSAPVTPFPAYDPRTSPPPQQMYSAPDGGMRQCHDPGIHPTQQPYAPVPSTYPPTAYPLSQSPPPQSQSPPPGMMYPGSEGSVNGNQRMSGPPLGWSSAVGTGAIPGSLMPGGTYAYAPQSQPQPQPQPQDAYPGMAGIGSAGPSSPSNYSSTSPYGGVVPSDSTASAGMLMGGRSAKEREAFGRYSGGGLTTSADGAESTEEAAAGASSSGARPLSAASSLGGGGGGGGDVGRRTSAVVQHLDGGRMEEHHEHEIPEEIPPTYDSIADRH
jgi:hypothetical protein